MKIKKGAADNVYKNITIEIHLPISGTIACKIPGDRA